MTISLVGEPSAEALERLDARSGLVQVDLRAVSEGTQTFLSVTALESFLLDGRAAADPAGDASRDVPGPSASLALAVLAVAFAARLR